MAHRKNPIQSQKDEKSREQLQQSPPSTNQESESFPKNKNLHYISSHAHQFDKLIRLINFHERIRRIIDNMSQKTISLTIGENVRRETQNNVLRLSLCTDWRFDQSGETRLHACSFNYPLNSEVC